MPGRTKTLVKAISSNALLKLTAPIQSPSPRQKSKQQRAKKKKFCLFGGQITSTVHLKVLRMELCNRQVVLQLQARVQPLLPYLHHHLHLLHPPHLHLHQPLLPKEREKCCYNPLVSIVVVPSESSARILRFKETEKDQDK